MSEYDLVMASFNLERLDDNLFQSRSPAIGWRRTYGGLLLAHATQAARMTVDDGKSFHSLHASFLRPGNTALPMLLEVEPLLDGRSIAHRRVTIRQQDKPVFTASISFRAPGDGLFYAPAMPNAISPEDLADEEALYSVYRDRLPESAMKYLSRHKVFEMRPVDPDQFLLATGGHLLPMLNWFRLRSDQLPDACLNPALLAYLSDMPVLNASLRPHNRNFFDPELSMASLDHALWQHTEPDWSDWVLASHESMATEAGMGLGQVRFFNRTGALMATVTQQGFIRLQ